MTLGYEVWGILMRMGIGAIVSLIGWFITFPLRNFYKRAKNEYNQKSQLLAAVHSELTSQRTNCLTTLQQQGHQQIEVLNKQTSVLEKISNTMDRLADDQEATAKSNDKIVEKLDDVLTEQSRTSGFLQGLNNND